MAVSGSEAVELALKLARAFTGRKGIVAFRHAPNAKPGSAATPTSRPASGRFSHLHVDHLQIASFPIESSDPDRSVDQCLEEFNTLMSTAQDAGRPPAAVLIEPIQVLDGMHQQGTRFLEGVIRIAKQIGALVVFDEINTGFGRCGALFYCNRLEIMPDLLVVGKSLGNGMPVSVVLGEQDVIAAAPSSMHASTYAGSPLACAAAHAVLDVIAETRLWEISRRNGAHLKRAIGEFSRDHGFIAGLRGDGMMIAFDCVDEDGSPSPALAKAFAKIAREDRHLLTVSGGKDGATISMTPPVLMNDKELNYLADSLSRVAEEITQGMAQGRTQGKGVVVSARSG